MKQAIRYGVVTGILVCFYILFEFFLGLHDQGNTLGKYTGFLSGIIPAYFIYRSLIGYRDFENLGKLLFMEGFILGIIVTLVSTVITTAFLYFYLTVINPDGLNIIMENNLWNIAPEDYMIGLLIENVCICILGGIILTVIMTFILGRENETRTS